MGSISKKSEFSVYGKDVLESYGQIIGSKLLKGLSASQMSLQPQKMCTLHLLGQLAHSLVGVTMYPSTSVIQMWVRIIRRSTKPEPL